jgi:hypothetical protein
MLSLEQRFDLLAQDLTAKPIRISAYHDLPFAILQYEPSDEFAMRRETRNLVRKLEMSGKEPVVISMADLLWQAIAANDGIEELFALERRRGFIIAQEKVTTYLSDPDWCFLPDLLAKKLETLDTKYHTALLTRVASMGPSIYHMSKLLDEMHTRTMIPTILFYPGVLHGTMGLQFMGLPTNEPLGNYRVKIY